MSIATDIAQCSYLVPGPVLISGWQAFHLHSRSLVSSTECVHGVSVFWRIRSHLAASVVQQYSLGKSFSSVAFNRKVLFGGHDISEERSRSPAKVDTRRCHVLDTKLIYSLLPANVHIAWNNYFKLLTISR